MTIILTGGGSGGHITPVLAVASELKQLRPDVRVVYVGQAGGKLNDIPTGHPAIDEAYAVRAGKFRRYHGAGWRQLFDVPTQAKNLRDAVLVLVGIVQSYFLIRRLHPSIIFTRGGYVSVPVALGGKLNSVPYITHDSDSTPSLANRLIARWAVLHAVALPAETYPYPRNKTVTVGVPVSRGFQKVDTKLQHQYRQSLGIDPDAKVLLVTGGGNGAEWLNQVVAKQATALLERFPNLVVLHLSGRAHEVSLNDHYDKVVPKKDRQRVQVKGFVTDLYRYSGAADVIVARGGATALAEVAVQGKACIIIPAKQLVWQTHHAEALAKHHAICYLSEFEAEQPGALGETIGELLSREDMRTELASNLAHLAQPDTAKRLAMLLLDKST